MSSYNVPDEAALHRCFSLGEQMAKKLVETCGGEG